MTLQVVIPVVAGTGAESGLNEGASPAGSAAPRSSAPIAVGSAAPLSFGVQDYELSPEEVGGTPDTQAGSHPFQLTTTLIARTRPAEAGKTIRVASKDLNFKLPPGLIGNPTPLPQCTLAAVPQRVS